MHPESYAIVERMATSLGVTVSELIENSERVGALGFEGIRERKPEDTRPDIREELLKPGRDPRDKFVVPKFRDDVKEIGDLTESMELEGRSRTSRISAPL